MKLIFEGTPEELKELRGLTLTDVVFDDEGHVCDDDDEEELTAEEKEDLEHKANELEFCATVAQAAKKLFNANYK